MVAGEQRTCTPAAITEAICATYLLVCDVKKTFYLIVGIKLCNLRHISPCVIHDLSGFDKTIIIIFH